MNELFKELLEKSGLQAYYEAQEGQIEKFAELIVRECGKSCTLQGDEDDMFRKFGIKHVGVE